MERAGDRAGSRRQAPRTQRLPAHSIMTDLPDTGTQESHHELVKVDASESPSRSLLPQMLVEEARDLAEGFLRFRRRGIEQILRVRHALEHLQLGLRAGAAELAVGQHRKAQEQVARAAGENGGREAGEVAVDRRELWILEVMSVRIKLRRAAEKALVTDQDVV